MFSQSGLRRAISAFRPPTARKLAAGPSAVSAFRPPTARKLAAGPSAVRLSL